MIFSSSRLSVSLLFASSLALSGCIVDLDAGGTGGTGGSAGSGGQGGSGAQGGGGQSGCDDHDDCPGSEVCVYDTGECRAPCSEDSQCGAGEVCNECVTSSCPTCEDCRGACEPAQPAGCDEHADCPDGLCHFASGECLPACVDGTCPSGLICDGCATSSCPECKNCVPACVPASGGCDEHADCPAGLCVFETSQCAEPCTDEGQCDAGLQCDTCGTSSCPACDDCVAVCLPAATEPCDDHADCPGGLCVFSTGQCAEACGGPEGCSVPGEVCDGCATASCPDCEDCLGACVPGNGLCDTSDDCPAEMACVWENKTCTPRCNEDLTCDIPGATCSECGTSSCPACEDCVAVCFLVQN